MFDYLCGKNNEGITALTVAQPLKFFHFLIIHKKQARLLPFKRALFLVVIPFMIINKSYCLFERVILSEVEGRELLLHLDCARCDKKMTSYF